MFEKISSGLGNFLGGKPEDEQTNTITADQLKVVLKSIEGKYNNLKNENKLYKSKIEEQKATVAELERAVSELKNAAPTTDATLLTQLEADLNTAQAQVADAQEAHANLRAEKLQLQSKLSVQEALVSSLRHEISELREGHANSASPEEHAKALAEIDKIKFDNAQLNDKVQELLGQLLSVEGLKADLKQRDDEIESLKGDVEESRTRIEAALQARRQAEVERDGVAARLAPILEELDAMREQMEAVEAERDKTLENVAVAVTAQEAMRVRAEDAEDQRDAALQDREELSHQVTRLQTEVEHLQGQLVAGGPQAQVLADLEERLLDFKQRFESAQAEKVALQGRVQQLMDEPGGLSAREKTELEFEIRRLTDELREAQLQLTNLRESKVKSNLDMEEAAAELVELRRQLDEMRRDRNQFRDRLGDSRSQAQEMDQLKSQMRDLMTQMAAVRGGITPAAIPDSAARASLSHASVSQAGDTPEAPILPQPADVSPAPLRPVAPPASEPPAQQMDLQERRRAMLNRLIGDKKA